MTKASASRRKRRKAGTPTARTRRRLNDLAAEIQQHNQNVGRLQQELARLSSAGDMLNGSFRERLKDALAESKIPEDQYHMYGWDPEKGELVRTSQEQ